MIQPVFHPLEEVRQGPFTDGHPIHLPEEGGQALVTDRMGIPQVYRQALDRGPKGRARLHPHRDLGHVGLATVGTLPGMLLHPGHDGPDRWQLDLIIDRMQMLLVGLHRAPTMGAGLGLGDEDLVGIRMQGPATPSTPDTGLATRPHAWTWCTVRLRGLRGRHT